MLEHTEVKLVDNLMHELLRHHGASIGVDLRYAAGAYHRFLKLLVHNDGPHTVVGAHHVQQDHADVLDPLIQVGANILQGHLGIGLQNHQGGGVVRLHVAHLRIRRTKTLLGVLHSLVDECEDLTAHLSHRKNLRHRADRLSGLEAMNRDSLPDLVAPAVDQIGVVHGLLEGRKLHVPHRSGKHRIDKDLVRQQPRHQSASVVLVLLLFPVAPCDRVI